MSVLDFKSDAKTPDGKPWNKKFASWNVNGIRAWLEVTFYFMGDIIINTGLKVTL